MTRLFNSRLKSSRGLVLTASSGSGKSGSIVSFLKISYVIGMIGISSGGVLSARNSKDVIMCPGLIPKSGVSVSCALTNRGAQSFNCSSPVPVETVAFYNCQKYFKQIYSSSPVKLMRCDESGKWTRIEHFKRIKCEYECGKSQPITKTLIINGRITTRQIWPWHALIYFKFDPSDLDPNSSSDVKSSLTSEVLLQWETLSKRYNSQIASGGLQELSALGVLRRLGVVDDTDLYYHVYICGGSLISPNKVLTAAHCLTNSSGFARKPRQFTVVLGGISNDYYTNRQDTTTQILQVEKIHISNSFNYEQFEGDIGIISLSQPAQLSKVILPVCLPENADDASLFIRNVKHGELIGSRPEISRTGLGLSTQLKSKKLNVLPTIECSRNIDRIPSDKEYCAGMPHEFICGGDSGGGMISSPNFGLRRRYTIQGIVSYARARQICDNYAVFTRVYKFIDWINHILKDELPS